MDLKGRVALFPEGKTTIDILDVATGVVQHHEAHGTLTGRASVQKCIAVMTVHAVQLGIHVVDLVSGKVLSKFMHPNGHTAQIALSKDTLTVAVGASTGTR
jgi:hypothetical protein